MRKRQAVNLADERPLAQMYTTVGVETHVILGHALFARDRAVAEIVFVVAAAV